MNKSNKFQGVYFNDLKNGDKAYFVVISEGKKKKWVKVGLHSDGIREQYCFKYRQQLLATEKSEVCEYTLNDIADIYFGRDLKSYREMHQRYKLHFEDFGKKKLEEIDKSIVIEVEKKELAQKTKSWLLGILRSLFNYAIENDIYSGKNPFEKMKIQKAVNNRRERFLSVDEIRTLMDAVKETPQIFLFVKLSLLTGGRLETICNIKKSDFDGDAVKLYDFKNNSYYQGYVDDTIKPLVLNSQYDYILQTTDNPNYISHQIQRKLQPLCNKLFNQNLTKDDRKNRVVIHTLRHTFASHLAINNVPIYVIQKLMNHNDIQMTLRYAKLAPDSGKKNVIDVFSSVF